MRTNENCSTILTCYNDYFILSRDPLYRGSVKSKKAEILESNRKSEYNGFMSPATTRKVRTILTTWIKAVEANLTNPESGFKGHKRKLTFVTLTLSQKQSHTDNDIKRKLLNRFLVKVQRTQNVKYYFWRAEKQKNGNIHFHLILDSYIDKFVIQTLWNDIQKDFGYLDNYLAKYGSYKAPSTDVRIISNFNNSIAYVMKYVSKNPDNLKDKNLKVAGRIWSCSNELKSLKPYSVSEDKPLITKLFSEAKKENIESFEADFFTIFKCDTNKFLKAFFPRKYFLVNFYYQQVYRDLYITQKTKIIADDPKAELIAKENWQPKQLTFDLGIQPNYENLSEHFDS